MYFIYHLYLAATVCIHRGKGRGYDIFAHLKWAFNAETHRGRVT